MFGFADYDCVPHSAVFKVISQLENNWPRGVYGADSLTSQAAQEIRSRFGLHSGAGVFFVPSGTEANRLAMATLLNHSWESVICVKDAHLVTFEAGATSGLGHAVVQADAHNGKVNRASVHACITRAESDIHQPAPAVISLADATELGTVYARAELRDICSLKIAYSLSIHLDGARLANAIASKGGNPGEYMKSLFSVYDIDAVTLGFAKNGGFMGDVLIVQDPNRARIAEHYHKQFGNLAPRMQFYPAQVLALLQDDLWLTNAKRANQSADFLASELSREFQVDPHYLVQTNAVFVVVPRIVAEAVVEARCGCIWQDDSLKDEDYRVVRFVTAWNTTEAGIKSLVSFLKKNWP